MALPFWLSFACLCGVQAANVALPRGKVPGWMARLRSGWWALVPLASIVIVVFAIRATADAASFLTWLALIAVPPLAALGLGWAVRGHRLWLALLAPALLALAWGANGSLAGQAAALALTALSCVPLAVLLAAVAPPSWLKVGIVLMAIADAILVGASLLQPANDVLNAVVPARGLPQLQKAEFGTAVTGYGDLFIAAVLGAVLARERRPQGSVALLTLGLALAFGLLFLVLDELPATVPVAAALLIDEAVRSRRPAPAGVGPAAAAASRPARRPCP